MKKQIVWLICIAMSANCSAPEKPVEAIDPVRLTLKEANRLAALPLHCIQVEYPNKLNQVLGSDEQLQSPSVLHPAFYGCFDWHSSVHGHWMLVSLLRQFPELEQQALIRQRLSENISKENIEAEVAYFFSPYNDTFERTYGWAWLLKLAEEIYLWDDPLARELEENLKPLTELIVEKYLEFLPKLLYPIRSGEHTNIAFGMSLAYDYAKTTGHTYLQYLLEERALFWFANDRNCPVHYEPSGFDFLSPCFQEIDIMRKVLPKETFLSWIKYFLPELLNSQFKLEPAQVSDRSDGKLVHLDGLNFSRAWVIYGLLNNYHDEFKHLIPIANAHIKASLPQIVDDNYEGTHWLGSFAVYALQQAP
ncbi:MAG: DUF2891 domain-containing protein [Cyclobacteriaceae bacterium]|nr:DUF2891 domain-containing protein [Cyclobacteriaceae bacterium]